MLTLAQKPAILNIPEDNPGDLAKHHQILAHFGLKYPSNDGINRDRFHCKNFLQIHTFRPATANF